MLVDFHAVYVRYSQDVYRFALYLSGCPALADDIVQETFVRAWSTPAEIRVGTVKAYLFMIARNLYRTEFRRATHQVPLNECLQDPQPDPTAQASLRSDLRAVLDALQSLPEIDRAALLMHAQDGMPYTQIAATLGSSVAAVKVKVHRSRIKLKQICQDKEHPT
jgi:RNA polymerase sigma-70 factor (ECF subfamily)